MVVWSQVIKKPIYTEKSAKAGERGVFTFSIHLDSGKEDVKIALKNLYGVTVSSVRIQNLGKKVRKISASKILTRRQAQKRAIVQIKAGEKLDLSKFSK